MPVGLDWLEKVAEGPSLLGLLFDYQGALIQENWQSPPLSRIYLLMEHG